MKKNIETEIKEIKEIKDKDFKSLDIDNILTLKTAPTSVPFDITLTSENLKAIDANAREDIKSIQALSSSTSKTKVKKQLSKLPLIKNIFEKQLALSVTEITENIQLRAIQEEEELSKKKTEIEKSIDESKINIDKNKQIIEQLNYLKDNIDELASTRNWTSDKKDAFLVQVNDKISNCNKIILAENAINTSAMQLRNNLVIVASKAQVAKAIIPTLGKVIALGIYSQNIASIDKAITERENLTLEEIVRLSTNNIKLQDNIIENKVLSEKNFQKTADTVLSNLLSGEVNYQELTNPNSELNQKLTEIREKTLEKIEQFDDIQKKMSNISEFNIIDEKLDNNFY